MEWTIKLAKTYSRGVPNEVPDNQLFNFYDVLQNYDYDALMNLINYLTPANAQVTIGGSTNDWFLKSCYDNEACSTILPTDSSSSTGIDIP